MTEPPEDQPFMQPYFGPPATRAPEPAAQQPVPAPVGAVAPPPGYAPYPTYAPYPIYGPPRASRRRLQGHRIWASLAQVVILADVIQHLVVWHALTHQRDLLRRIMGDPYSVSLDQANAADHAATTAAMLLLVLLLVGGIFFIVWLFRLRTDIDALAPDERHLAKGMAVGGWFIPLANLVLPFAVVRDVAKSSRPGRDEWGAPRGSGVLWLVGVWWALWVVGAIGSRFIHLSNAQSVGAVDSAYRELIVLLAVEAVAGLLAIAVIEALTRANRACWATAWAG